MRNKRTKKSNINIKNNNNSNNKSLIIIQQKETLQEQDNSGNFEDENSENIEEEYTGNVEEEENYDNLDDEFGNLEDDNEELNKKGNKKKNKKKNTPKKKSLKNLKNDKNFKDEGLIFTDNGIVFPEYDEELSKVYKNYFLYISFISTVILCIISALYKVEVINILKRFYIHPFLLYFIITFGFIFFIILGNFLLDKIINYYRIIDFDKGIAFSRITIFNYLKDYNIFSLKDIIEVSNNTVVTKYFERKKGKGPLDIHLSDSNIKKEYNTKYRVFEKCIPYNTLCFLLKNGILINFYTLKFYPHFSKTTSFDNSAELAETVASIIKSRYNFNIKFKKLKNNGFYEMVVDKKYKITLEEEPISLEKIDYEPTIIHKHSCSIIFILISLAIFMFTIFCI